jgi:HEAT repeat protein
MPRHSDILLLLLLGGLGFPELRADEFAPDAPDSSAPGLIAGRSTEEWNEWIQSLVPSSPEGAAAVPVLVDVLLDSDMPDTARMQAALLVGRCGEPVRPHVPRIAELLRQPAGEELGPADWGLKCLALLGPVAAEATPDVRDVLQSPERSQRERLLAIEALGRIGPANPQTLSLLVAVLDEEATTDAASSETTVTTPATHERLERQVAAVDMIATFGSAATPTVPRLVRCARSTHEPLRWSATTALGAIGSPLALSPLVDLLLFDESAEVRHAAAVSLSQLGPPAVPTLVQLLEDPEPEVRARAADALRRVGRKAASADRPLQTVLDDSSPLVRLNAMEALWAITGDAAVTVERAATMLDEPDRDLRRRAFLLLVEAGSRPGGEAAVPLLEQLAESSDPRQRQQAMIGLREIARRRPRTKP